MRGHHDLLGQLIRVGALAALVAAIAWAAGSASRVSEPGHASGVAVYPTDLDRELRRCQSLKPEQLADDEACGRAWAESRRRFLAPGDRESEPSVTAPAGTPQPSMSPTKDLRRLGESHTSAAPGRRSE
jgi:conjugative transfer region protein TrbK